MGKKKPRPPSSFTPEFKAGIVELCRRGDRSVGRIAKDFDLTETALRLWVSQAEVTASHGLNCSVDDCVLMVSELVTNTIVYGEAEEPWRVRVEWWRVGDALLVDVHNPGFPAQVRMRRPDADDAHGRGLCLVDSLSDSWSSGPSRFGGTRVSFRIDDAWKP